jgi:two-component system response regulator LytT
VGRRASQLPRVATSICLPAGHFLGARAHCPALLRTCSAWCTPRPARFLVKSGQTFKAMSVDQVAYFLAEEDVIFLVTHSSKWYILPDTLDQLESQLDARHFFRINHQFILSVGAVQEIRPSFKGRLVLQVASPAVEKVLVVSAGRAPALKQWLIHGATASC